MSSKNDLGGEEFDKITFVRMEDVQPSCGNQLIVNYVNELPNDKETCSDDSYIHYLDEDSNIGSMVSIKSSTVLVEHDYSEKYIIPDSITDIHLEKNLVNPQVKVAMDRWPTLEILPGGVIRHAMKPEGHAITKQILEKSSLDKMYACAICSDSYRDLYSLVKHVKCHQVDKKMKDNAKIGLINNKCDETQLTKKKKLAQQKCITKRIPKRHKI